MKDKKYLLTLLTLFAIQLMNWIDSCSRQRTLSGMHFLRMPLLAELATRRPESKSGSVEMLNKICLCSEPGQCAVHPVPLCASGQKYTRNICKAIEKCQKKQFEFRTCIRITHVALHLLYLCLLPPVNLTSQDLPAKQNYVCVLHASAHSMANALGNWFRRTVSTDLWSDKAS